MIIPIRDVGKIGLVTDQPYEEIPLNAWTRGQNVRFRDGAVEKFSGHSEVYTGASIAPYWLLPVNTGATNFWLYGGQTAVGATDGATHADISRAVGGAYGTSLDIGWTGTVIEGIPVINNGVDVPQMWNTPGLLTKLTALTGWNAAWSARSMRSFKRYLMALDITKTGTRYPFMVKWSDSAPAGGVPLSWDETNPTLDAGEFDLPADGGYVIDALPIRDSLMLYKEYQSWLVQYVGGNDIFTFRKVFDSIGMLTRRSAIEFFNGQHLVFTGDDIVRHDSQQAQSLLDTKAKALISGIVDSTFYVRSYITLNYPKREVWVCVPELGHSTPSLAIVWNWVENTIGVRQLPDAAFIQHGIVNPISASELWSGAVGGWDTDTPAWGDKSFDPTKRSLLMAIPGQLKFMQGDTTDQFDGSNIDAFVERVGIGFPIEQDGPPDFETIKQLNGIWPRISGTAGAVITVYVGTQDTIDGPITWGPGRPFTIGQSVYVDCTVTARLHALRFESTGNVNWRLRNYDVDVVPVGKY